MPKQKTSDNIVISSVIISEIICDDCLRGEQCYLNEAEAESKFLSEGWRFVNGDTLCPNCVCKIKA